MVVGVWELVLFLWSHPIISCMFLLFFSPPFFPIIVYFSPLLICTGLVAVAMVSMNMGDRAADSEDWRNNTRNAPVMHHVEQPVKPAREGWLEWMKEKEEKAKAWVDNRFVNQNKWQLRNKSAVVPEEDGLAVDSDPDDGYRISTYKDLSYPTPVRTIRVRPAPIPTRGDISPPETVSEVPSPESPSAEPVKVGHAASTPLEEAAVSLVHDGGEDSDGSFAFPTLEERSVAGLEEPLCSAEEEVLKGEIVVPSAVMEEVLKGEIVVPSAAKEEGKPLPVVKARVVAEKEIPSAPKAESLEEKSPASDSREDPRTAADETVSMLQEDVLPRADITARDLSKGREETKHETTAFEAPEAIASEEPSVVPPGSGRGIKIESLHEAVGGGAVNSDAEIPGRLEAVQNAVVDETRSVQTSTGLHGSRLREMEALGCGTTPELRASGEDRKASPEAEAETSFFIPTSAPDVVQPLERFAATEKIIFVDEPSKFTTVPSQTRSMMLPEADEKPIKKPIEQMVALEAEPHEVGSKMLVMEAEPLEVGSKSQKEKDRSRDDGLDENIESCDGNAPPTAISSASAVALQSSEQLSLVSRSTSGRSESGSASETSALVPVFPQPSDSELLTQNMEPKMTSNYNDAAPKTSSGSVLDKSYSLHKNFTGVAGVGVGEEQDDLTARFHALKKSMSLHTARRWEQPVSLRAADATNAVVLVDVPDNKGVTRVESEPFPEILVFPEKSRSSRPRVPSGPLESVEAITARLLNKFTPSTTPFTRPPSRPVPTMPAIAFVASSVAPMLSDKSPEIAPSDGKSLEVAPSPLPSVESDKVFVTAPAVVESDKSMATAPVSVERAVESSEKSVGGRAEDVGDPSIDDETVKNGLTEDVVAPPVEVSTVKNGLSSKKSLTSFLSRRRERLMSSTLMEAFSNSGEGEKGKKTSSGKAETISNSGEGERGEKKTNSGTAEEVSNFGEVEGGGKKTTSGKEDVGTAFEIAAEDREEGSTTTTTSGRQLKEKMISPLKRVFSIDANSGSSDRKGDASGVKASPIREKQSVMDRSRGKFKKLFSSEGGLSKSESAEVVEKVAALDKISLRKSKSKSASKFEEEQNAESKAEQPASKSASKTEEQNGELGAEQNAIEEQNGKVGAEQIAIEEQNGEVGAKPIASKSASKIEEEHHVELGAEQSAALVQDQDDIPSSTTSKPEPPSEADGVHVAVQSEQQVLPGIEGASLGATAQEVINKPEPSHSEPLQSEPLQSEPLKSMSLKLEPVQSEPLKSELLPSEPLPSVPLPSEPLQTVTLPSVPLQSALLPAEPVQSEPLAAEEEIPPSISHSGEADHVAEERESKMTKSSSEKKFSWSWTKKKRCSDPQDAAKRSSDPQEASVDQFRSPDRSASWSAKGIEEESRVVLMSPLTKFHSSSAIMSPVNENARTGDPSWDENHSSEFRFSRTNSRSNYRDSPKAAADSSPYKKSPISWWSPKPYRSPKPDRSPKPERSPKVVSPAVEKVDPVEIVTPPPKAKKASTSWWSRRHSRSDSKAVQFSSPPDPPPAAISGTNTTTTTPNGVEKSRWTRRIRSDSNAVHSSSGDSSRAVPSSSIDSRAVHSFPVDSKLVQTSSSPDFHPTGNSIPDWIENDLIEKSGPLFFPPSTTTRDENNRRQDATPAEMPRYLHNDSLLDEDGDDDGASVAPRPRHRRERSESLPSRATFSRLRGRQASLSEITLPRTPELSPTSSSGRATDSNMNGTSAVSKTRMDVEHQHLHHHEYMREKRNGSDDLDSRSNSGSGNSNVGWRTASSATPPFRTSSIRTLNLANEQLKGGSPFHRSSDRDLNGSGYRNSPSGAEISITDKLKVPLEEVLSLLSTGDSDEQEQQCVSTADSCKTSGRTVANDSRRAASSSSSEEQTSSEEEWSATSEDEDESVQQQQQQQQQRLQQQQQQFAAPVGRIRRRLPHYIFSRGEATAN